MIGLCLLALSLCSSPKDHEFVLVEGYVQKKYTKTVVMNFSNSKIDKKYCIKKKRNVYLSKEICAYHKNNK